MSERAQTAHRIRPLSVARWLFVLVWVMLLGYGFSQLYSYSHSPGAPALPKYAWPANAPIQKNLDGSTLLVFVHPQCPCSAATISELERLVVRTAGRVEAHVFFYKPKSKSDAWAKELLWNRVAGIPTVTPHLDEDGSGAEAFGARTSGQVFLYDRQGALVFRGGITPERGHMGDSMGRESILAFVEEGRVPAIQSAVFGCSIRNPERAIASKGEP